MPDDLIARVDALAEKATKGELRIREMGRDFFVERPKQLGEAYGVEILGDDSYPTKRGDAELIVALVNAWPQLRELALAGMAARAELEGATEATKRLERLVYVPGALKCAKCGFRLVTTNLHVNTGQISANNEPQECANGCGPMWRVTERDAGNELIDRMDKLADDKKSAEQALAQERERVRSLEDAIAESVGSILSEYSAKLILARAITISGAKGGKDVQEVR